MRITCPSCHAAYMVEKNRVPRTGGFTRCVKCLARFHVERPPEPEVSDFHVDSLNLPIWGVKAQTPKVISFRDNFGRRYWIDRRQALVPTAQDHREGGDRRGQAERRAEIDRRSGGERRDRERSEIGLFKSLPLDYVPIFDRRGYPVGIAGPGRRSGDERRSGLDRRAFLIL